MKHKLPEELAKWYDEAYCLVAVKQDGRTLQYVREQTLEICLVAVKQNGHILQYVREQTLEIILAAVKQNGYTLQYVNWEVLTEEEFEYIKLRYLS